jgi:hypothetical protein
MEDEYAPTYDYDPEDVVYLDEPPAPSKKAKPKKKNDKRAQSSRLNIAKARLAKLEKLKAQKESKQFEELADSDDEETRRLGQAPLVRGSGGGLSCSCAACGTDLIVAISIAV